MNETLDRFGLIFGGIIFGGIIEATNIYKSLSIIIGVASLIIIMVLDKTFFKQKGEKCQK